MSKPSDVQRRSPLASPQRHYHTQPGQVSNAPDTTTTTHYTEHVGSNTASAPTAAAAEPSLSSSSSSTSVGVPAADSAPLPAATDDLTPQAQAVEGEHDALRQQEAVLAADDTSAASATAVLVSKRKHSAEQSAAKKAAKPRQRQEAPASLSGSNDATTDESSGMNAAVVVTADIEAEPGQCRDKQGNSSVSVDGPSTGGSSKAQQVGVKHSAAGSSRAV